MAFSVRKAIACTVTMFVLLAVAMTLVSANVPSALTVVLAAIGALAFGAVTGVLTRDSMVEVPGASIGAIDAAMARTWGLRGFRRTSANGDIVYRRGIDVLGDRFKVYPTATGVRLEGPFIIINRVKLRSAA